MTGVYARFAWGAGQGHGKSVMRSEAVCPVRMPRQPHAPRQPRPNGPGRARRWGRGREERGVRDMRVIEEYFAQRNQ
jgi:hypothetical protein